MTKKVPSKFKLIINGHEEFIMPLEDIAGMLSIYKRTELGLEFMGA